MLRSEKNITRARRPTFSTSSTTKQPAIENYLLCQTFRKSYSNTSARGACIEFAIVAEPCVVYENAEPCPAGCRTEIRAVERACAKGSGRRSVVQLCRLWLLPKRDSVFRDSSAEKRCPLQMDHRPRSGSGLRNLACADAGWIFVGRNAERSPPLRWSELPKLHQRWTAGDAGRHQRALSR